MHYRPVRLLYPPPAVRYGRCNSVILREFPIIFMEDLFMETRPYVAWDLIESFMIDVFKAYGVPEEDAKICTDVLLESDRRGIESHGCNRFKPI